MKKLKVAILWHQHQPYYKYKNEFLLPWVRLHGVKDYYDLPALLNEFPNVKQTFNLAPSLMVQIEDYINNVTVDRIQRLTTIKAKFLTDSEKQEILSNFFVLNYENLVKPYPRFKELYDLCQNNENVINDLKLQDWLDLQVWYNLAWIGQISRKFPFSQRLFNKGRNFTEDEKLLLLEFHNEILGKIIPEMALLKKLNQIDISCSPMHHPILPLLCDSASAKEAMPNVELPNPIYKYPEDAKAQISNGINYYSKLFNAKPSGMWPSEGSVSNETLELLAGCGIKWIASDEGVLAASLKEQYQST
jgi:alpha-amylase/alpha-mannosidase (GH57 family)